MVIIMKNLPTSHENVSDVYTLCPQKTSPFYFFKNNSVKIWTILIIFGMLNPEKIWHKHFTDLFTSPVRKSK